MKTKIRNISLLIVALILVFSCCLALVGCGGDDDGVDDTKDNPTVDEGEYDENGGGGGTSSGDSAVVYTLTFDLNYEGAEAIEVTVTNGVFDMPASPTREGYLFSGWYADANATENNDFDFDSISGDATVYAKWIQRKEGMVYVTYDYNLNNMGTYKVQELESDATMAGYLDSSCRVSGYKFKGWYYDAECTEAQSNRNRVTEDITLYALWYEENIFEAEYTDLMNPYDEDEMRAFQGYSQNGDPIYKSDTASNGYYIADMYINEAYIYFDIYADEAVEVDFGLRVAMDYGWGNGWGGYDDVVTISDSQYTITVNGSKLSYGTMTMNGAANLSNAGEISNWEVKELGTIALTEGKNTIRLQVSNSNHGQGGTEESIAPLVDYMVLYAPIGTALTWNPVTSNIPAD